MKFLHFADLHLDAPFAWAPPEVSRRRRQNRRETLKALVTLAADERVDAILSAGDLFEHDRVTPDTVAFLQATFASVDIPIFLAPGNHDWYGPTSPYVLAEWSPNVHVFTADRFEARELAPGWTLWGAAHRAPANTDDFFAGFRTAGAGVHLALAHASERNGLLAQEGGKQPHAPFDAAELAETGLTHAFLGHYHVARDAERFTYPGNPDPLEFGESGERGAVLATVAADGTVLRERRIVACSEVHDLEVRVDGCRHADEVRDRVAGALAPLRGSVRVTVSGELDPEVQLDLDGLRALGGHLEGLVVRAGLVTVAYDLDRIATEPTVRGVFVRDARRFVADPDRQRRIILTGLRAFEERSDLEVA